MLPYFSTTRHLFSRIIQVGAFGYGMREGFRENASDHRYVIGDVQTVQSQSPEILEDHRNGWLNEPPGSSVLSSLVTSSDEDGLNYDADSGGEVPDPMQDVVMLQKGVRSLIAEPSILRQLIPGGFPGVPLGRESAFIDAVVECIKNEDIIACAAAQVAGKCVIQSKALSSSNGDMRWCDIIGKHRCAICLDLLAAPCVTSCHHTFCGECVQDLLMRCESVDGKVEVLAKCPLCNSNMSGQSTFCLQLDEDILDKVQDFPNCPEKEEWAARRLEYRSRLALESCKTTCSERDEYDEEWAAIVGSVAVAALVLVMVVAISRLKK